MGLKNIHEISKADIRNSHFCLTNTQTGDARKIELADFYQAIGAIQISKNVPEDVYKHFDTARNLFLYSWFVYEFATVSEMHAKASVEFALKERVKQEKKIPQNLRLSLKKLIALAIDKRWILDEGFYSLQARRDFHTDTFQSANSVTEPVDDQAYCKVLLKVFPGLRNDLAHGSNTLGMPMFALENLQICAEFINQLFSKSPSLTT